MRSTNPDELIKLVSSRTKDEMWCLHFAQLPYGYCCLDLRQQIVALTLDEQIAMSLEAYDYLKQGEPVPMAASEQMWRALLDPAKFTYKDFIMLPRLTLAGVSLCAVVLEGEF